MEHGRTSIDDVCRALDIGLVCCRHLPVFRVFVEERREEARTRGAPRLHNMSTVFQRTKRGRTREARTRP